MNKSLEILEYFAAEQMTYDNTPFLLHEFDEAIAELEAMEARIKELEEAMKPKTCNGCKTLPFVLTELSKKNGGKCGTCKRYVKDNYQAEPKEQG